MTQDDKQFMSQFLIVLGGLVVFTVVIFVIARVLMSYNTVDYGPMIEKQVAERTAPVGEAHSGEVPKATQTAAAGGGSAAGEQTYAQVCSSCHDSGASGAPKITAKADWESRIKQGKQTLYDHAINGIGAMPAKGGDPSLSDEEVQAAVDYIVATVSGGGQTAKAAGGKAKTGQSQQASAPSGAPPADIAQAAQRGASPEGKSTYQAMCSSCHDSGALGAPMVTDKAQWQARIAIGAEALYSSAINGVGAMPAKGGHSQLSEDEVKGAVDYIIAQVSGGKASGGQAKSGQTKQASATSGAAPADVAQAAQRGASPEGKSTYQAMCSSCHDSGALGAPMVTDKAAWKARIVKGPQALYTSAIGGIGAMPAKGGHSQLSEDEVKGAVDYIIAQVSNAKAAGANDSAKSSTEAGGKNAPSNKAGGKAGTAAGASMTAGKKTYESVCASCHGTGMAGAPKYGDKAAWASHLKEGKTHLYETAINGGGAMPPKGGNPQLSDEDVKAAVDYMLNAVQ
ncbi:MAG: cytochrome c5 family protein [Gammaproteobacteria bacterium]|nr:cytochrome c5 family protein [Gammaproteobacteria bacterium]